ncbi:MAG: TolC family protein [Terriglobia bacterium]
MSWSRTLSQLLITALLVGARTMALAGATKTDSPPARLEELVREALTRNPEIQAAQRGAEAKRARVPQAKAWSDPTLTLGYGGNILPPYTLMRGDPSSQRQFMAEQVIPYPGKTRLRGEIAAREADAEATGIDEVSRRVVAEVKQAYVDLYFADQSLSTLAKERQILEQLAQVSQIRYSVGKGVQQDIIRAQVELTRLSERQTMLEQTRRTLEAQLNSLRDLPVDTPVGPASELRQSVLVQTPAELQSAAESTFPALKRQQAMIEGNQLAVNLAHKEVRPDFSVGYTYMQRAGLPDMYGFTFSTSLPVFRRNKQDQAIREAALNLEAAQRSVGNQLTLLRYRVKQEFVAVEAADRLMKLYTEGLVPQSRLALESSLASYEAGASDFQTVLSNFTTILEYELNYHQQLANHEKALARLEELTGLELVR